MAYGVKQDTKFIGLQQSLLQKVITMIYKYVVK